MFKSGCIYSHATARDLNILILKVRFSDKNRSKLLIRWIDKVTGNVRNFPGSNRPDGACTIEIQEKDYKWWSRV